MPQDIFPRIRSFYLKQKRMPSYSEIMNLAGYKSKSAVFKLVSRLIDEGVLSKDNSGRLLPTDALSTLPILGTVEAGFPSPAEEELLDTMSLEEFLIGDKDATYILKISGDSMIDAGILPGDMALVERGHEPKDGDIVIAEVDHHWTVKYFRKHGRRVFLAPGNKKYHPIHPTEELRIAAVVKSIIRKY